MNKLLTLATCGFLLALGRRYGGQIAKLPQVWNGVWYYYHSRSATILAERFVQGWGDGSDSIRYEKHIKAAIRHRGLM